jgi:hypothetical protein
MFNIKNTEKEVLNQIKRITLEFFNEPDSEQNLFRFCKITTRMNQLINNRLHNNDCSSDEVFDVIQSLYSEININSITEDKNKVMILEKLEELAEQQASMAFFESNTYAYARTRCITGLIYHINNNDLNNNFNLKF